MDKTEFEIQRLKLRVMYIGILAGTFFGIIALSLSLVVIDNLRTIVGYLEIIASGL